MKFKKKTIIIIVILAAIMGAAAYFKFGRKEKVQYVTAKVGRGNILQTVSETGTVRAAKEIDLNFLVSGKIAKILIKEGDKVSEDQVLAELDYSEAAIKEREAQANLNKLMAGARAEEIAVAAASVNQAKAAYAAALSDLEKIRNTVNENIAQAEKSLNDLLSEMANDVTAYEQAVSAAQTNLANIKSTYQKSIDNKRASLLTSIETKLAVANTALDNINTVVNDQDAANTLSVKNIFYLTNTKDSHAKALSLLSAANAGLSYAKAAGTDANILQATSDASAALNKTLTALNYCYGALENSVSSSSFTQTELDAYKTNISTQTTSVTGGISAVETAKQNFDDAQLAYNTNVASAEKNLTTAQNNLDSAVLAAKNNLATAKVNGDQQVSKALSSINTTFEAWQVAKAQLDKIKAPARAEDAAVAQAALDAAKKQIENSRMNAPIEGIITKVNYEIGESFSATKPVISMLGDNNFEIEVLISEADIAKIAKDAPVEITLDAFGGDVKFAGKVSFIEPASTVVQDVVYYKVKVVFTDGGEKLKDVKSGMTANVVITTARKENVLIIPGRAVVEKSPSTSSGEAVKIARLLVDGEITEMSVELGIRGDEGMVEILSGVKEGDVVVVSIKENK